MGTVVVGLDGATWRVLARLAAEGRMPFLGSLLGRSDSAHGVLVSTDPPITGAAWLALATGLNPGRTGVIDFFARSSADSFTLRFVGSSDFIGRSYWDILGLHGGRSAVILYPTLYPPYPVKGCMVSGFGAPGDGLHSFPEQLGADLQRVAGEGFKPVIEPKRPEYRDLGRFVEDVHRHIDGLERIAGYIVGRCSVDSLTFVISVTDWIQHRAWHVLADHPLADRLGERSHRPRVEELYTRIDELLYRLYEYSESVDSYFLLVSDHGFQHHLGVFNLFKWLAGSGYIVLRKGDSFLASVLLALKGAARKLGLARFLRRHLPEGVVRAAKISNIDLIDLERSLFIVLEHSMQFGAVYVNPRIAGTREERQHALQLLRQTLEAAAKKYGISLKIHRREDLYRGERLELLPDAIIEAEGYSCAVSNTMRYPVCMRDVLHPQYTGIHDKNGILLVAGRGVKPVKDLRASIYDVMPTVLFMHQVPIPREVDGKPLEGVVRGIRGPLWEDEGARMRRVLAARARLTALRRKEHVGGEDLSRGF